MGNNKEREYRRPVSPQRNDTTHFSFPKWLRVDGFCSNQRLVSGHGFRQLALERPENGKMLLREKS